ncbi:MAG: sigma 54-interacting transcriptional regulator [Leptospirillum sp.]|nr:sigma 54-interacting transcriptional regulator [Nitrospiraceae bacterium]
MDQTDINSNELLRAILEASKEPQVIVGSDFRIHAINTGAKKQLCIASDDRLEGLPCKTILGSELCRSACTFKRTVAEGPLTLESTPACLADQEEKLITVQTRILSLGSELQGVLKTFSSPRPELSEEHCSAEKILHRTSSPLPGQSFSASSIKNIAGFAKTSLPIIIEGETGTGKEFLARMIHENGPRKKGPFVVLDATHFSNEIADSLLFGHRKGTFTGAIGDQKGRLEAADKGTLFIDELQNMSLAIQMKLLRFLDRKTLVPLGSSTEISIDTRILVATNEPLSALLATGRLRSDFFYRIRGKTIRIPSLREQLDEIPALVSWKFQKWEDENKTPPPVVLTDSMRALQSYSWPGNIRELFSFLDYMLGSFSSGEKVPVSWVKEELKSIIQDLSGSGEMEDLEEMASERELIIQALRSAEGEIGRASEMLGMSRTTLWRKMKKLGIRPFEGD